MKFLVHLLLLNTIPRVTPQLSYESVDYLSDSGYKHYEKQACGIECEDPEAVSCSSRASQAIQSARKGLTDILRPVSRSSPDYSVIPVYHAANPLYHRPRVQVTFGNMMISNSIIVLFDTGSDVTFVNAVDCRGHTKKILMFGTRHKPFEVPVLKKVKDVVTLIDDQFRFKSDVLWTKSCPPSIGRGILGASKKSPFSVAAQAFAYVSRPSSDTRQRSILIGTNHNWSDYCLGNREPVFIKSRNFLHSSYWILLGAAVAKLGDESFSEQTTWIVDTGASNIAVPPNVHDHIVKAIAKSGSKLIPSEHMNGYPKVTNCNRNHESYPSIVLQAGRGAKVFEVVLTALNYLIPADNDMCSFLVTQSSVRASRYTYLLGEPFLSKAFTVFSEKTSYVGFCSPKN